MSEEFFLGIDPRLLDVIAKQRQQEEKGKWNRSLYSAGIVASMVYNVNRGKGKKAMKPEQFLIKEQVKNEVEEKQNLDDPKQLFRALSGRVRIREKKK